MDEHETPAFAPRPSIWSLDRLVSFTDSVFAFAITLLVLNLVELHIPAGTGTLVPFFQQHSAALVTFVVTFIIIARFWVSHIHLFAAIRESDRTIVNLNIALLFFITIFPFVASVLGTHIGNKDAVIMYAVCFAIIGLLQYFIGRHAFSSKLLVSDDLTVSFLRIFTMFSLSTPIVFIVSIGLAFASPTWAEGLWVLLLFIRTAFRLYYRNNQVAEREVDKL